MRYMNMLKIILTLSLFALVAYPCFSKTSRFSVGASTDIQLESPVGIYYGAMGSYALNGKSSIQATTGMINRSRSLFLGADYIFDLLRTGKAPSLFVGGGTALEFGGRGRSNEISFNGQVGFKLEVDRFIPFIAFKEKFFFEAESFDSGNVSLGLRYSL